MSAAAASSARASRPTAVRWNLSAAALYEEAVRREEGVIAAEGPLACRTGQHTGRSPNDKFIVREPSSEAEIAWGKVNRPIDVRRSSTRFTAICSASLSGKELFVLDCFAGADPAYRLPVRVITEYAWHNLFCRNLFIDDPAAADRRRRRSSRSSTRRASRPIRERHGTQLRGGDRAELREAARADRRHAATPAK